MAYDFIDKMEVFRYIFHFVCLYEIHYNKVRKKFQRTDIILAYYSFSVFTNLNKDRIVLHKL